MGRSLSFSRARSAGPGRLLLAGLASIALLAACTSIPIPFSPPAPTAPPTSAPAPTPTPAPTPDQAAAGFFSAWQQGQYDRLYGMLSDVARAGITQSAFVQRYRAIHDGIGESKLSVQAQPAVSGPAPAAPSPGPATATPPVPAGSESHVPFDVTRTLDIFGDVRESNDLPLVQEQGTWKVAWHPGLIFQGLTSTSQVRVTPDIPTRGRILDRHDKPLADNGTVVSVGVVPGQVKDEAALLKALSDTLQQPSDAIKRKYQGGQPDWFMPIAVRPASDKPDLEKALGGVSGVQLQDTPARIYPLGEGAAHVTGYLAHPTADELKTLGPKGYDESDWVGRAGLEAWGEDKLAGQRGGKITIVGPEGRLVRTIAQKAAVPGVDLHLTIDATIQEQASKTLGDKSGSIVVMDPRDDSLLAIASHPTFDPNQFILGLSDADWAALNAPSGPLVLRATESAYPTGSTFKIITMAAGLEKGGFKPTDTFDCGMDWNGLPGVTLHNWQPEGHLDLVESLTESCNPAFYTVGLKLDQTDPNILPDFARAFGLGKPTGVQGLPETAGVVPDPAWKQQQIGQPWTSGDSVNLAIGQGYLLATPLQLANAYAAFANGGTLRTPLLVRAVGQQTLAAEDKGKLPISAATRSAILEGMRRVTSTPQGTAAYAFKGERTPIAAKTGSAENENPDAHAWFAGYMTPDKPTTLAVVMIEGGQHGGTVAAPLAREILDAAYPLSQ